VWSTEKSDSGGYLEVTIGPCESDTTKTCGVISAAFSKDGIKSDYEHLGKLMIKDMKSNDGISYSGGTIWDLEKDKIYTSKLKVKGDVLKVDGCISFICVGQNWARVDNT
jgi:uncharacterized protein (DUF2147 family)